MHAEHSRVCDTRVSLVQWQVMYCNNQQQQAKYSVTTSNTQTVQLYSLFVQGRVPHVSSHGVLDTCGRLIVRQTDRADHSFQESLRLQNKLTGVLFKPLYGNTLGTLLLTVVVFTSEVLYVVAIQAATGIAFPVTCSRCARSKKNGFDSRV